MSFINIKVEGQKAFEKAVADLVKGADSEVERLVGDSMKRIQLGAFKKAPVLTGLLSSTLVASENVTINRDRNEVVAELVASIPYIVRQEFENRTKPAFIRTSTVEEYPVVMRSFEQWAKGLGK